MMPIVVKNVIFKIVNIGRAIRSKSKENIEQKLKKLMIVFSIFFIYIYKCVFNV